MGKSISFVQGDDLDVILPVVDKFTGKSVCLEGFEGATAFFPPETGTEPVAVSGSVYDADQGLVKFSITHDQSPLVKAGTELDYEYAVERNDKIIFVQEVANLFVSPRQF